MLFSELRGRAAFCFGKDAAEIVPAAEAELLGNLLNGEVRALQQDFGPSDFGILHIITDAEPRFFFEPSGQIVFRITDQFRQVFCPYFVSLCAPAG